MDLFKFIFGSYITLQPKTGHTEDKQGWAGQYLDGDSWEN